MKRKGNVHSLLTRKEKELRIEVKNKKGGKEGKARLFQCKGGFQLSSREKKVEGKNSRPRRRGKTTTT